MSFIKGEFVRFLRDFTTHSIFELTESQVLRVTNYRSQKEYIDRTRALGVVPWGTGSTDKEPIFFRGEGAMFLGYSDSMKAYERDARVDLAMLLLKGQIYFCDPKYLKSVKDK